MNNTAGLFTISGYQTTLLAAEDLGELQSLLERCADYSLLLTGSPPKSTAAASLLTDCPPQKTPADKIVIGFYTEQDILTGVLDAVHDYPAQDDWWLGLLLLDPAERSHGLGRRIYQSFEQWLMQQGARRIFLGVLEDNPKAHRFWQMMGFELIEKRSPAQSENHSHNVLTMARNLAQA